MPETRLLCEVLVRREFEMGLVCPDTMLENLKIETEDFEGFEEIIDYSVEGGEITIQIKFNFDIDIPDTPRGSHPHWCASDCGLCDAQDNWQEAYDREVERIVDGLEGEVRDILGFLSVEAL